VQICKGGSDDAGTYDADEAIVRRALKRLDELEGALLAQPVAEGPTDDKLMDIALATDLVFFPYKGRGCASPYMEGTDITAEVLAYARAALAKYGTPTPQPVAVSERLPGPEDCLDEGWAWFFNRRIGWRQAGLPVSPGYTHWLPANALPTPEA
jgi:hypothetical protein